MEEFNHELREDNNYAQILIKITPSSNMLEEAKKIIEKSGASVIETIYISSYWVLIKLDVRDIRDIGLKLTEHGFFIHGINATN